MGSAIDASTGYALHAGAAGFVTACGLAAWLVRRRSLRGAVAAPPLLYALVALLAGFTGSAGPRTLVGQVMGLFIRLTLGAPVLYLGTLVALGVAVLRV